MTSAEPSRTSAYSTDIGWRVVWQRIGMGLTYKEIAYRLQIAVGTAHRLFQMYESTGDVAPLKRAERYELRKLDNLHEIYIIGLICENPAIYLREVCGKIFEVTGVRVSTSTVCKVIHRNGITRKKLTKAALQRSLEHRAAFMANMLQYPRDFFVWVDETGTDRRDQLRKFGYAIRGQPAVCTQLFTRGKRISAVVAMSSEGVEASGSNNGEKFVDFVRGSLIPVTQPFPDRHSIVIMDNCSIHHIQAVKDLFDSFGVLLVYLPPYSPDYNPIEELFSYLKYYLKEHEDLIQAVPSPVHIIQEGLNSVTSSKCNGWINHSGYST